MTIEHRYYRVTPSPEPTMRTLTAEYFTPARGWRTVRNNNTLSYLHMLEHGVVPPGVPMPLESMRARCTLRRSPCGEYYIRKLG